MRFTSSSTARGVKYFGAVRIRDGKFAFRREAASFDAATCHAFLRQLWRTTRHSGRRVVVIADNAGYHHARLHKPWRDARQRRLRIHFIPPYSPELNPIERVWKLTRRRCLHNRYFLKLEAVAQAVEGLFAEWSSGNLTLRHLCAIT
jgi:transposase